MQFIEAKQKKEKIRLFFLFHSYGTAVYRFFFKADN